MALLMLKGSSATVYLMSDPEDGQTIAACVEHASLAGLMLLGICSWTQRYDTLNDAAEYATDHADRGCRVGWAV